MGFCERRLHCFDVSYWFFQCHCTVTTKLLQSCLHCLDTKRIFSSLGKTSLLTHSLHCWQIKTHFFLFGTTYWVITPLLSLIMFPSLLTWLSKVYSVFFLNWNRYNFREVCGLVNQLVPWTINPLLWEPFREDCGSYIMQTSLSGLQRWQCGYWGSCSTAEKVFVIYTTF